MIYRIITEQDKIEAKNREWFDTYLEHIVSMAEKQGADVLEITIQCKEETKCQNTQN